MKLPRDASGRDVVKALCRDWGYHEVHQVGSHVVLETKEPSNHRTVVPDHKVLRAGTLNAIVRQVAHHKGVDRLEILKTL
jgi:predicted RNA binding protein YcfA (HicA-like mRNA interferase family)